ncbi:hypothetical protein [Bosea sp. Root381]|uniref:hypothetical protein n=1 Tax=Bosea sp. Root381 TaxID=1736524 RepID=UPI0012E3F281|nr:hypothetical protein [Bosea sp. Root381]
MPKRNSGSVRRRHKVQAVREAWRSVVADWQRDVASWGEELGPAPGTIGCLCPPDVLAEFGVGDPGAKDPALV